MIGHLIPVVPSLAADRSEGSPNLYMPLPCCKKLVFCCTHPPGGPPGRKQKCKNHSFEPKQKRRRPRTGLTHDFDLKNMIVEPNKKRRRPRTGLTQDFYLKNMIFEPNKNTYSLYVHIFPYIYLYFHIFTYICLYLPKEQQRNVKK